MDRSALLSTIATDICTGCGITAVTMDSVLDDIANNCLMPEDLAGTGALAGSITSVVFGPGMSCDGGAILLGGGLTGGTAGDGSASFANGSVVIGGQGNSLTAPAGGVAVSNNVNRIGGGPWIDLDTSGGGDAGIGTGGPGGNAFVGYAGTGGNWFNDSNPGDVCYRNTAGRILLGCSPGKSQLQINADGGVSIAFADYTTITGPKAGTLAWDYTNNVPVVYDGTYWYPFTLGAHY